MAAGAARELELALGLHALGDDAELGGAADRQRRLDDPPVALAGRARHEAAVELDARERQLCEPREAAVAGPEVVEVDLQAEAREPVKAGDRGVTALHQRRLGDL